MKKKIGKFFKWFFLILLAILVVLAIWNGICGAIEKGKIGPDNYGTSVEVNGHTMVADIVGEKNDTTVIVQKEKTHFRQKQRLLDTAPSATRWEVGEIPGLPLL